MSSITWKGSVQWAGLSRFKVENWGEEFSIWGLQFCAACSCT